MVRIFYVVPEDHDTIDEPNLFLMQPPITLQSITSSFPLPGQYRFRLGIRHKTHMYWMDIKDSALHLPPTEGNDGDYYIKATRIARLPQPGPPPETHSEHRPSRDDLRAPQRGTSPPPVEPKKKPDVDDSLLL